MVRQTDYFDIDLNQYEENGFLVIPTSNNQEMVRLASRCENLAESLIKSDHKGNFQFQNEEHNFGEIYDGDVVSHIFTFTNTGKAPLIISKATASCGCTVPSWPKQPIAPGGKGQIQVQFDSSNKPGIQNKVITITSNTETKVKKLLIKAQVSPKS